jgi:predicted transposase YdaD
MLTAKFKLSEAKAVWFEEGMEQGRAEGRAEGLESGLEKGREETARNALVKGLPLETICDITGLDMETIKSLHEENISSR